MRYRKLDAAGDYTIGAFYVNEPLAVGQAVRTRLALFAGEWFIDTTDGTPWRTDVLGKFTKGTYDTILRQRILGTAGVLQIASYSSAFDARTRTLTYTATLDTAYGQASLTGTL